MILSILCIAVSVIDFSLGILFIKKFFKLKKSYLIYMGIISFGIFYDSFIVTLSGILSKSWIKTNEFKSISLFRYVLHGMALPLCIYICAGVLNLKNKKSKLLYYVFIIITFIFCILGMVQGFESKLKLVKTKEIMRYAIDEEETPKWVSKTNMIITIFSMIVLIITGIIIFIQKKNLYLLVGSGYMLLFGASSAINNLKSYSFFLSMFGEMFMIFFIYLYIIREENDGEFETKENQQTAIA